MPLHLPASAKRTPTRDLSLRASCSADTAALQHAEACRFESRLLSRSKLARKAGRADADDDGVAIFWRASSLEVMSIGFLSQPDNKASQGAVQVS